MAQLYLTLVVPDGALALQLGLELLIDSAKLALCLLEAGRRLSVLSKSELAFAAQDERHDITLVFDCLNRTCIVSSLVHHSCDALQISGVHSLS